MKVISVLNSIDKIKYVDGNSDGIYSSSYNNGEYEILSNIIKDRDYTRDDYVVINYKWFFDYSISSVSSVVELIERIPNLVVSSSDIKSLLILKKKISRKGKKVKVASRSLTKGVDYFIYPNVRNTNRMIDDIIKKSNNGIGILINSDSFRNRDGVLSLLNDKIEREESVIIYTDKPNHYLKLVR